jgi:hypothetical protein
MTEEMYHGVPLMTGDAQVLVELEKILGKPIPCLEDRDKTRQDIAGAQAAAMGGMGAQAAQIAQLEASLAQMESQSMLKMQYQQALAMEGAMDQQTGLDREQLIELYVKQMLASINPAMVEQIKSQLAMLIPMMGENHPSVLQMKAMIDMDEPKARAKAELMVQFYEPYLKLRSIVRDENRFLLDKMYDATAPESEVEEAMVAYLMKVATPEYQTLLDEVLAIGPTTVGAQDPNFAKIQMHRGLTPAAVPAMAKQLTAQMMQSLQMMKQQQEQQTGQLKHTLAMLKGQAAPAAETTQESTDRPVNIDHFGFICDRKRVIGLNIAYENASELPENVGQLDQLRVFQAEMNKLTALPESIGNLQRLEKLDLSGSWSRNDNIPMYNAIKTLPASFGKLRKLREWKMDENGLESLPDSIGGCSGLITVSLNHNHLKKLPVGVSLWQMCENLNLRANKFTDFPQVLSMLKRLDQLDLGFNEIDRIPEIIGQFANLTLLILNGNKISKLPDALFGLKKLATLGLGQNQITEIPLTFTKLSLRSLSLEDNQLPNLPYHLWSEENLETLRITGNPFPPEEAEIAQNDANTIKEYCRQRASISIMFIYSQDDIEDHRIPDIIAYLEKQPEVFGVLPAVAANINGTDLALFMATADSINDPEMLGMLQKVVHHGIGVVPIKGTDIDWGGMAKIGLSRELGHEYTPKDFDGFCERVYDYIKLLKRTHNIFKSKTGVVRKTARAEGESARLEALQKVLSEIIHSEMFTGCFNQYQPYLQPLYAGIGTQGVPAYGTFLMTFSQYLIGYLQQFPGKDL